MTDEDFHSSHRRSLGLFLNGRGIAGRDERGRQVEDDSFLIVMNAEPEPAEWKLPDGMGDGWEVVVDTGDTLDPGAPISGGLQVADRSMVVLIQAETPQPALS
jgi:glycogen operon protein